MSRAVEAAILFVIWWVILMGFFYTLKFLGWS
jgi:hypothetical protein